MRGVGHEIAAHFFESFELRDIMKGNDRTVFVLWLLYAHNAKNANDVNMIKPIRPDSDFAMIGMDFVCQDPITRRLEFGASDHLEGPSPFEFRNP